MINHHEYNLKRFQIRSAVRVEINFYAFAMIGL